MTDTTSTTAKPNTDRGNRRVEIGVVTRDKMDKTRRVEIPRLVKHPKYGKYIKRRTICYAHDEANISRVGDTVEIMETRPLSKLKHWRVVQIVAKGPGAAPAPATIATPPEAAPPAKA
jgi:small subunit ribosomal protein S17